MIDTSYTPIFIFVLIAKPPPYNKKKHTTQITHNFDNIIHPSTKIPCTLSLRRNKSRRRRRSSFPENLQIKNCTTKYKSSFKRNPLPHPPNATFAAPFHHHCPFPNIENITHAHHIPPTSHTDVYHQQHTLVVAASIIRAIPTTIPLRNITIITLTNVCVVGCLIFLLFVGVYFYQMCLPFSYFEDYHSFLNKFTCQ